MKRKHVSIMISVFAFLFVFLVSETLFISRATFYKASSRTLLQSGNVSTYGLASWLIDNAPKSGTDNVTNSSWVLTSDRTGEWRYAGKNPDNYVLFNGELWRIIGIMSDMEYCTGTYGTATECDTTKTGNLVKIIRNSQMSSTIGYDNKFYQGSSNIPVSSNDWSDSQLMLMLNGANYLQTGYDTENNALHLDYTVTNNTVYDQNEKPFYDVTYNYLSASPQNSYMQYAVFYEADDDYNEEVTNLNTNITSSYLPYIATVKWSLYGSDSTNNSPSEWYNIERNINNAGSIMESTGLENRPAYWYGKVGLMYPSDYGYATNGGTTYNRAACLSYQTSGWNSGSYKTDCAMNSYLIYSGVTSTAPTLSGENQWTLTPYTTYSNSEFDVSSVGIVDNYDVDGNMAYARPVLYLKVDTKYYGGTGTWDDPYRMDGPTSYWFDITTCNTNPCYFPTYGGTLQSTGLETGHNAYVGMDKEKYYVCATSSGHEVCLSQPYTQYGLTGHSFNTTLTSTDQTNAMNALLRVFQNAGFNITSSDCDSTDEYAICSYNNIFCEVNKYGSVDCTDRTAEEYCNIGYNNELYCAIWDD